MLGQYQVLGVRSFKGTIDGRDFDSTTLLVVLPFAKSKENTAGFNTVAVPYGKAENFPKFKGRQFPISCQIDMESTVSGYEANEVKFEPITQPTQQSQQK